MRVLFIQDNGLNESLALCELSAVLKEHGHTTSVLLERETSDLRRDIDSLAPDVVLLPSSILAEPWVVQMCRLVKAAHSDIPVVLAGSLPTLSPRVLARAVADFAIIGEAELPMLGVMDVLAGRLSERAVPGLISKRRMTMAPVAPAVPIADLDTLPLPDRGLYFDRYPFMARFPWKKLLTGRGCLYDCIFCYLPALQGMQPQQARRVRQKSAARVIAEAKELQRCYPVRHMHFSDDLFVANFQWIHEFAMLWRDEVGITYSINTTADFITQETATLLAESGCRSVSIGVESANENLRRQLLKKNVRDTAIRQAAELIHDRGMQLVTYNMLAGPQGTLEDALETLKLNIELRTHYARVTIASPLPGTRMATMVGDARSEGEGRTFPIQAMEKEVEIGILNLYHLFNWGVSMPGLLPWIERLVRFPFPSLLAPANFLRLLKEKQQFGLGWLEGLAYFRHVGMPDRRTANFVSLVA